MPNIGCTNIPTARQCSGEVLFRLGGIDEAFHKARQQPEGSQTRQRQQTPGLECIELAWTIGGGEIAASNHPACSNRTRPPLRICSVYEYKVSPAFLSLEVPEYIISRTPSCTAAFVNQDTKIG